MPSDEFVLSSLSGTVTSQVPTFLPFHVKIQSMSQHASNNIFKLRRPRHAQFPMAANVAKLFHAIEGFCLRVQGSKSLEIARTPSSSDG